MCYTVDRAHHRHKDAQRIHKNAGTKDYSTKDFDKGKHSGMLTGTAVGRKRSVCCLIDSP